MRKRYYRQIELDVSGGFMLESPDGTNNLTKKHLYDAGLDIVSREDVRLYPMQRRLISTGLYLEILPGYVGLIWDRSGLAVDYGIMIGAGCIDATYRGEVKVLVFNLGERMYKIHAGDRIAQLITIPANIGMYIPVPYLSDSPRGESGFGSSGK